MGGLELLSPRGLWLLGLLAPLIVLYILKVKRKRLIVPSTWLWQSAKRDLLAKAPFRKLLAQLSLILQALAVIALAFALAQPSTKGNELSGARIAIVVDVSASMSATDDSEPGAETTRLERARKLALDMVRGLPPGAEAMVVEAGREARIVSPLDRDTRRITTAIETLSAHEVEGDLGAAVALAVDRLKTFEAARVVVVTDGYLARPPDLTNASVPVEILTVGTEIENVGIVRTDVRSGADPKTRVEEVQGFLLLQNFGKAQREVYATIRFADETDVLASRRLLLAPGATDAVVLSFHPTEADYGKGLVFDISPHDAMPVDDVAYARVPAGDRLPVVLAGPDRDKVSTWLVRALESDPGVTLEKVSVTELAAKTDLDPGALVVIDGACPADPPGGDVLIVHPPAGNCWGATLGDPVERPLMTSWETGDPRMRFLTLDGVVVSRASKVTVPSPAQALVRSQDGVLVADISTASRAATLVGFDVGESDWPLKASYVLFMRNVTELARTHRASGILGARASGEPLRVNLPPGTTDATVVSPSGDAVEASLRGGLLVAPTVTKVGHYKVNVGGARARTIVVPVNLTSALESDVGKRAELPSAGAVTVRAPGELPERYRDYTWVLALVALLLVVLELFHFTRKPRPAPAGAAPLPRLPERKKA